MRRLIRFFSRSYFLLFLILFLLVGRFIPVVKNTEDLVLHRVTMPILNGIDAVSSGVGSFFRRYVFLTHLEEKNEQLALENKALQQQLLLALQSDAKLIELQTLLDLKTSSIAQGKVARLVGYNPMPGTKTLLIDKGAEQGIQTGQVVLSADGVVGLVLQARPHDATVITLLDGNFRLDVELSSGARGSLKGTLSHLTLNRNFWLTRLEYLQSTSEVKPKDLVFTSGLDGVFPQGLLVGEVLNVKRDEKGLFLAAEVLPAVDFSKLRYVRVLTP